MYLVFGKKNCFYCEAVKDELQSKGIEYVYVDLTSGDAIKDHQYMALVKDELKAKTLPQVFKLVGGFTELNKELK